MATINQEPVDTTPAVPNEDGEQLPLPQNQHSTQLEFIQAMQDFHTMFPDVEPDVIEAVLRANKGAVDSTIDQLLTMTTDNENERLRAEFEAADNVEPPTSYVSTTPPPSYLQAVAQVSCTDLALSSDADPPAPLYDSSTQLSDFLLAPPAPNTSPLIETDATDNGITNFSPDKYSDGADDAPANSVGKPPELLCPDETVDADEGNLPLHIRHKWQPPMLGPLPPDFLRIVIPGLGGKPQQSRAETAVLCSEMIQQKLEENARQRQMSGLDDPDLVRYLEDERFALFLQNEEFMQELRCNTDFLSTLERDDTDDEVDKSPVELDTSASAKFLSASDDSDAIFRERLKNMGKISRRKFAQLASLFTRRKKRSAKQMLSVGALPSTDNLLQEDDDPLDDSIDERDNNADDVDTKQSNVCQIGADYSPKKS